MRSDLPTEFEADRFLTVRELMDFTSIRSPNTLRSMVSRGLLPKPTRLSAKRIGWRTSAIKKWAAQREAMA